MGPRWYRAQELRRLLQVWSRRKRKKGLWLCLPTQLPIQKQWWSNRYTHTWHFLQCFVRQSHTISHTLHLSRLGLAAMRPASYQLATASVVEMERKGGMRGVVSIWLQEVQKRRAQQQQQNEPAIAANGQQLLLSSMSEIRCASSNTSMNHGRKQRQNAEAPSQACASWRVSCLWRGCGMLPTQTIITITKTPNIPSKTIPTSTITRITGLPSKHNNKTKTLANTITTIASTTASTLAAPVTKSHTSQLFKIERHHGFPFQLAPIFHLTQLWPSQSLLLISLLLSFASNSTAPHICWSTNLTS